MCMLQGVRLAQVEAMPICGLPKSASPKPDRAQHGARRRLLQAIDHQARILAGSVFCLFAAIDHLSPSRCYELRVPARPESQLPVSTMRRSRQVMINTPTRVHSAADKEPARSRRSPRQITPITHREDRRQRRHRRDAGHRITLHQIEISGVRDQARADRRERKRTPCERRHLRQVREIGALARRTTATASTGTLIQASHACSSERRESLAAS